MALNATDLEDLTVISTCIVVLVTTPFTIPQHPPRFFSLLQSVKPVSNAHYFLFRNVANNSAIIGDLIAFISMSVCAKIRRLIVYSS